MNAPKQVIKSSNREFQAALIYRKTALLFFHFNTDLLESISLRLIDCYFARVSFFFHIFCFLFHRRFDGTCQFSLVYKFIRLFFLSDGSISKECLRCFAKISKRYVTRKCADGVADKLKVSNDFRWQNMS